MSPNEAAHDRVDAQVRYLLVWPGEGASGPEAPLELRTLRDAPYFAPVDIDVQQLGVEEIDLEGCPVSIRRARYEDIAFVAECAYALDNALGPEALRLRLRLQAALRARLLADWPEASDLTEEYTVLLIGQFGGTPDEFIDRNRAALARFMRSQREAFTTQDVQDILISRVSYSDQEMTLVDWESAVILSAESDFQSDVELLKIGNYQLLRYRLLDRLIESQLATISRHLEAGTRASLLPSRSRRILRQVVENRLMLMLNFEKIKEELLLIGDWYTAKLYRVIYDEFYLDEWEAAIKSKLDNLESVLQVIQENFEFSWSRFLELVQIAGWLLLLIGYFVLFFIDVRAYQ